MTSKAIIMIMININLELIYALLTLIFISLFFISILNYLVKIKYIKDILLTLLLICLSIGYYLGENRKIIPEDIKLICYFIASWLLIAYFYIKYKIK